jgi:hypothetical protein
VTQALQQETMPPMERLLKLEWEPLACVVCAMEGGARWADCSIAGLGSYWKLIGRPGALLFAIEWHADERAKWWIYDLPNPLRDTAAACELETRELSGWIRWNKTVLSGNAFRWFDERSKAPRPGPWHPDRRTAALLAALHKYAEHPTLGVLCKHLLSTVPDVGGER